MGNIKLNQVRWRCRPPDFLTTVAIFLFVTNNLCGGILKLCKNPVSIKLPNNFNIHWFFFFLLNYYYDGCKMVVFLILLFLLHLLIDIHYEELFPLFPHLLLLLLLSCHPSFFLLGVDSRKRWILPAGLSPSSSRLGPEIAQRSLSVARLLTVRDSAWQVPGV